MVNKQKTHVREINEVTQKYVLNVFVNISRIYMIKVKSTGMSECSIFSL